MDVKFNFMSQYQSGCSGRDKNSLPSSDPTPVV